MLGFLLKRYRKFFIAFVVFVILLTAIRLLAPNVIVAYRTLYIVSHVVPAVPEWFEWGSYEVEVREVSLEDGQIVDVYLPQSIGRTGFVLFFPGFNPDGARDPRMVNLARAFAGAGIGVAVPDSGNIKQQRFSQEDIDLIKDAFYFLKDESSVDPAGIGLSGFSIAGSYVLRAAAEIGDDVLFVHTLGAYYDLAELFEEVRSERVVYGGNERPWTPSSLSKEIADTDINMEISKEEAEQLSPASVLTNIKTRVYLMHDRNDDRIPVEHSRKIRDALPKDIAVSYSEFSFFQHITPQAFLSIDILKLSGQMFSIMKLLL